MKDKIGANVGLIIDYINDIRLENTEKNYINKIEFEFRDKYNTYRDYEFKRLLDEYCKKHNIIYKMHERVPGTVYFIMELDEFR